MTPDEMAALAGAAYQHMRPWTAEQIRATLASRHSVLVTSQNAFVLGQVIVGTAEVFALAVDPVAQRRGEGRACLVAWHSAALGRDATESILEVADRNAPAKAFYTRMGYGVAGRRRGYYTDPDGKRDDAVIMRRALP